MSSKILPQQSSNTNLATAKTEGAIADSGRVGVGTALALRSRAPAALAVDRIDRNGPAALASGERAPRSHAALLLAFNAPGQPPPAAPSLAVQMKSFVASVAQGQPNLNLLAWLRFRIGQGDAVTAQDSAMMSDALSGLEYPQEKAAMDLLVGDDAQSQNIVNAFLNRRPPLEKFFLSQTLMDTLTAEQRLAGLAFFLDHVIPSDKDLDVLDTMDFIRPAAMTPEQSARFAQILNAHAALLSRLQIVAEKDDNIIFLRSTREVPLPPRSRDSGLTFDREVMFDRQGRVAHGASAASNLGRMVKETFDAVNPLNNILCAFAVAAGSGVLGWVLFPVILFFAIIKEVGEIVLLPFLLLKDLLDIFIHLFSMFGSKEPAGDVVPDDRNNINLVTPAGKLFEIG